MYLFGYAQTSQPSRAKKHHGLLNQGATCYLNSVLQVLFMTEDFREAVERHTCETCGTECIDRHLASLFDDLKERTAYTYKITNKLDIDNVHEQRDAAQYFEKILGLTSPEVSQIFHGLLTHRTRCSSCSAKTEADGAFWHLPLPLVDSNRGDYRVVDGIQEYFKDSDFSGDNQMYCDECDAKSDATIECVIKRHPDVLMLLLKRFEFDYRFNRYVKINRTVVVPYTLQLPKSQMCELYAVVDHIGGLKGGHYTATIKSQDDEKWYKFNDDRVTLVNFQPFQVDNFEKFHNAYLLFYRKKGVHAADACTKDIREVSTPEEVPPPTNDIYDQMERGDVEGAVALGDNTAVFISTNEEIGSKDIVSGGGLSSDLNKGNDNGLNSSQSIPYSQQERNEERTDLSYRQDAHVEIHRRERKIMRDAQRRVMDGKTNKDGDKEQSEKTKKPKTKHLDRDAEHQDNGGLDNISENMYNIVGEQEVGQDHSLQPVNVDKQGNRERMERDDKVDKEGKTRADERGMASLEFQDNRSVVDSKPNMPKDDQRWEQGSSWWNNRHEQPKNDKRDVEGVKEQKRGDDKYAEMRDASMTKQGGEDQDKRRSDGVRQDRRKQEISVTHSARKDVSVEEQAEEQDNNGDEHIQNRADSSHRRHTLTGDRRVMDGKTNKDRDKEQSEKKKKPKTKHCDRAAEHQDNGGLDNISENMYNMVGKQEVGQDHSRQLVNVDKQGNRERMERDDKVDKEGKTRADERGMASLEFQDNRSVVDSKPNMPKDDQRWEQGSSCWYNRHEQSKNDKRDVEGVKEQKKGDDKYAETREASMTKQGGEDQDKRRSDGVRQDRRKQEISVTHSARKDVSVEEQAEEQDNNGDEHIQNRADSSHRRHTLTGGRTVIEDREVGGVEKMRRGNSLPKARTGFNEDTVKGISGPVQPKTYHVKIIEEENKEIPGKTKNLRIKYIEETIHQDILSEDVSNLNLSDSPLHELHKRTSKRAIGNVQEETNHSNTKKKQKVCEQSQWGQNRKEKNKQTNSIGCWPFICKSKKNADQTPDSD